MLPTFVVTKYNRMNSLKIVIALLFFNTTSMAKEINTEIIINATPQKVWSILTNFKDYPSWNPFIESLVGEVAVGKKITVRIAPPESSKMTFNPKVLSFMPAKELRWLGHFLIPGLFDGEHIFELIDNKNGTTTFRQREKFKGVLVFLFKKQLDTHTTKGFMVMNQKLKELAEKN